MKPLVGKVRPSKKVRYSEEKEIIDKTLNSTDDEQANETIETTSKRATRRTSTREKGSDRKETNTPDETELRLDLPGTVMRIEGPNAIFTLKDGKVVVVPRAGIVPTSYDLPPDVASIEGINANYLTTLQPRKIPTVEQI